MFAYCRNNPTLASDHWGLYEIEGSFEMGIIEIKLESFGDMALLTLILGKGIYSSAKDLVGAGALIVAAPEASVAVAALAGYADLFILTNAGVKIAENASNLINAYQIYNEQGYVYYSITAPNSVEDLIMSNSVGAESKIPSPSISTPQVQKPNRPNGNSVIVAGVGKITLRKERT